MSDKPDNSDHGTNGKAFGDAELSALYQQTRTEQPPPHVDAAVLAMARQHAHQQLHPASPFSARWPIAASMVAVLVLAFGLVTFMQWELEPEQAIIMNAPAQKTDSAKKKEISMNGALATHRAGGRAQPSVEETETAGTVEPLVEKPPAPAARRQTVARENGVPTTPQSTTPQSTLSLPASQARQRKMEKKAVQAQRLSQMDAQLKAPQAAMASKSEPAAVAPMPLEQDALHMSVQGLAGEESRQSLQKTAPAVAAACRGKLPAISARDYWRATIEANGRIVQQDSTVVCVVIDIQGTQSYRHIALTALQDRQVKQQVFIDVLNETSTALAVKKLSAADQRDYLGKLQRLTGLTFDTIAQWQNWYDSNKATLTLSTDGQYLVSQRKD